MARRFQRQPHARVPNPSPPAASEVFRLYRSGRPMEARAAAEAGLRRAPDDVRLLTVLAMVLDQLGAHHDALPHIQRAAKLDTTTPLVHAMLGTCLRMTGHTEPALESYDRALALEPANPPALAGKVRLLLALGRPDDAEATLEPHLSAASGSHQITLAAVRLRRHQGRASDALKLFERRLESATDPEAVDLLHLKADLLDAEGRYEDAADTLSAATYGVGRFDPDRFREMTDRFVQELTPDAFDAVTDRARAAYRPKPPTPMFVLGPPRSGTTLTERILARHPSVHPGGEQGGIQDTALDLQPIFAGTCPVPFSAVDTLTKGALGKHARQYRKSMPDPPAGSTASLVTDKLPGNVLNIPLVRAVFPDAPIVYCERDPRDTAVSCFLRQFGPGLAWTRSIEHISVYLEQARRVVVHARDTLGINLVTLNYEKLATSPDTVVPALLAELNLDPCDACLTPERAEGDSRTLSAEQVTKPINTASVGRWKNYRDRLAPFFDVSD